MLVLGIDPGSRVTGYGVLSVNNSWQVSYVASGCVKLSGAFSDRIIQLYDALTALMQTYPADHCAIESVFMHKNPNSALKLGHARGVCMLALTQNITAPAEYAPRLIKQTIVGRGQATKSQVQFMVQRLLGLQQAPAEDAADALAVAWCHLQHLKRHQDSRQAS